MRKIALAILTVCLVGMSGQVQAAMFYVAPNAYPVWSSTLDVPWQTAVGSFFEADLNSYSNAHDLDVLTMGPISVDVGLGGLGGVATTAEIFAGTWGGSSNGSVYGTVSGMGLLNRDSCAFTIAKVSFWAMNKVL